MNIQPHDKVYRVIREVDGVRETYMTIAETASKARYRIYKRISDDSDLSLAEFLRLVKSVRSLGLVREPITDLNPHEILLMEHSLGVCRHIPYQRWGYRNHFVGGEHKDADYQAFFRLQNKGLAEVFEYSDASNSYAWGARITEVGARQIGLREQHLVNAGFKLRCQP